MTGGNKRNRIDYKLYIKFKNMREGLSKEKVSTPEEEHPIYVTLCASRNLEQELTTGKFFFDYSVNPDVSGIQKINEKDLIPKMPEEDEDEYLERLVKDQKILKIAKSIGHGYGRPIILSIKREK